MASEPGWPTLHEDAPLFRRAVEYTSQVTGFRSALVEKDYFCSVLLRYVFLQARCPVVFKGGTCLAKVHAQFYRLSEDLDFCIPVSCEVSRSIRSRLAKPFKQICAGIGDEIPAFAQSICLRGFNDCTQYLAELSYESCITLRPETIKVEVGLREPLMEPATVCPSYTLLLNPITGDSAVSAFPVRTLTRTETYAEKLRAALTRRDPAVRDFFDLDYAVEHSGLELDELGLLECLRAKLRVPGNPAIDITEERFRKLEAQLESRLRPVMREQDYRMFDLNRAFDLAVQVAAAVSARSRDD